MGANPKKGGIWDPLIKLVSRRLVTWRNRFVSLGGRVALLNSVLNFIHVFFLSFMKMLVSMWRKLVDLQRYFLWRGSKGGTKVVWVKWVDVCKAKRADYLG